MGLQKKLVDTLFTHPFNQQIHTEHLQVLELSLGHIDKQDMALAFGTKQCTPSSPLQTQTFLGRTHAPPRFLQITMDKIWQNMNSKSKITKHTMKPEATKSRIRSSKIQLLQLCDINIFLSFRGIKKQKKLLKTLAKSKTLAEKN